MYSGVLHVPIMRIKRSRAVSSVPTFRASQLSSSAKEHSNTHPLLAHEGLQMCNPSAAYDNCKCVRSNQPLDMCMQYFHAETQSSALTSVPPWPRSSLAAMSPVQPSVGWSLMEITSSPAAAAAAARHAEVSLNACIASELEKPCVA
jgi:hypothetical protein